MEDSVVLYGAVLADDDVAVIGADHRAGPDAGAFPDDHVADDVGRFTDEN
jgi:hypothetical protein